MSIATCTHCNNTFNPKSKHHTKFCSNSCSAKHNNGLRIRTLDSRLKTSMSLKKAYENNKHTKRVPKLCKIKPITCCVCSSLKMVKISDNRLTCSKVCRNELIRRKTLGLKNLNRPNSGYFDNIWFDSSWEVAFYIWSKDNIPSLVRNTRAFKFENMTYVPDFFDGKRYYEVKGEPYYNNLDLKLQKMAELGMVVIVIDQHDIKPIIKYVKTKYSVKNIRDIYLEKDNSKTCEHCKSTFKCDRVSQIYCSRSCAVRDRHLSNRLARGPGIEPG